MSETLITSEYYQTHKKLIEEKISNGFDLLLNTSPEQVNSILAIVGELRGLRVSSNILEEHLERIKAEDKLLRQRQLEGINGLDISDEFENSEEVEDYDN